MTNKTFIEQVKELDKARTLGDYGIHITNGGKCLTLLASGETIAQHFFYPDCEYSNKDNERESVKDMAFLQLAPKMAKALISIDELCKRAEMGEYLGGINAYQIRKAISEKDNE